MTNITTDKDARKNAPMARGVLDYFPAALASVAEVSRVGNEQHNPGQPMHWAKEKSTDHADCILRHLADRGTFDTDGLRHAAKVAWRALALLQTEIEAEATAAVQRIAACGCTFDASDTTYDCHGSGNCHMERARQHLFSPLVEVANGERAPLPYTLERCRGADANECELGGCGHPCKLPPAPVDLDHAVRTGVSRPAQDWSGNRMGSGDGLD